MTVFSNETENGCFSKVVKNASTGSENNINITQNDPTISKKVIL